LIPVTITGSELSRIVAWQVVEIDFHVITG
jgi:hypothetical protein